MKLYVASKWEDRAAARELMDFLEEMGHHITYDWTGCEQFSTGQAELDKQGVMEAEALVFLAYPDRNFKGAYVEMGIAVARDIPIYLLGAGADGCLFTQLPKVYRERQYLDDLVL